MKAYYFCPDCQRTLLREVYRATKYLVSICGQHGSVARMRKSRAKHPAKRVKK